MRDRPRLCIPLAEWPAADQAAWERAISRGEIFDPAGLAARWRPKTRRQVVKDYGMWLSHLTRHGCDIHLLPASERLKPTHLRSYATELRGRLASESVCSRMVNLSEAYRVMFPEVGRRALADLIVRLRAQSAPSRKKHARIRPSRDLLSGGLAYMEHVVTGYAPSETIRAAWVRNGMVIAMLAAHPVRLANLAQIEIGQHLTLDEGRYWLRFEPAETKDRQPLAFPLIAELTTPLTVYIEHYRPLLLAEKQSDRLWISVRKTPMSEQALYCQVVQATTEIFGAPINPHLFRDCLMTTLATDAPEMVRIGARLLGHSNLATGERHYNQALMQSAATKYHASLAKLRGDAPPSG